MSPSESALYHPEERALLRAVAGSPADDLPRFVYADWLDENGFSVRAEFIRLQCRIAELEIGPREEMDRHVELWKRQQQILDHHWEEIVGPPGNLVPYIEAIPIRASAHRVKNNVALIGPRANMIFCEFARKWSGMPLCLLVFFIFSNYIFPDIALNFLFLDRVCYLTPYLLPA